MTRKIFSFALVCALTLTLVACGPNKYRIEKEGMPDSLRATLEEQVTEGEELLDVAADDDERTDALHRIAFSSEQLGRFDKAIPLYKEILTLEPNHYSALNNLGVIYERVGEYETAAQYYGQLLEANPSETSVLKDAIRALISAKLFESAQLNLENFARHNSDNADEAMLKVISDQYEKVQSALLKSQNED